ncbi:MAG: alanine--tRNA ligase [Deltaproteobacteria bacterium]|nr:MAG: alanine--tRNA ligase [Deltaproteobacteria bacterium]
MTGAEIRAAFLSYFERHGHKVLPSSPLVPGNDPSLLFTNAGMVQFKEYFLGLASAGWKRAATAQRCLRVSGKHNDLENVGYTARHHTLFEMLGNFSFGDYFKKDAIFFGWDFLTREMGIDGERMTVSVFREDDEAYDIWHKTMGLPASRIVRFDEEDNFWAMGPTGPCGPCSEIIYDQGEGTGCGRPSCAVGCDCDRFLEIWNLVFMQFNQGEDGTRTPLPKPSIDTGMGLERLAAAIQGVKSNYDTDLFRRIIADIERLSGVKYGGDPSRDAATRVIADHSRATAFLIADGVLPANEGRGYVLRRIMRRALRHGKKLGFDGPFLHKVAAAVVRDFSPAYPELERSASFIDTVALNEEKRFLETLDAGLRMVEEEFARIGNAGARVFAGSVAFKLYDTFGFPVDLTADLCRERGVALDTEGFEAEMERQRAQSREAWKGGEVGVSDAATGELSRTGVSVEFVGYDRLEAAARVVALFRDGERVMSAAEGEEVDLVTDVTPFYGESGGQAGDAGEGTGKGFRLAVTDASRPAADLVIHRAKVAEGTVSEGMTVDLRVDSTLRARTQANHTATHLLQAALRKVLGGHVKQAGSYVGPDKLRFDFTHFEATPADALRMVEDAVNDAVFSDRPVTWERLPYEEAIAKGAMAFFGEKYADEVRMVTVPGVSRELCGGTHVRRTGEIAMFRIVSEGALAAGVRRIEALTGPEAFRHLREDADRVLQIALDLKVSPADAVERVRKLQAQVRALEKDVQEARRRSARDLVGEVLAKAQDVKGVRVVEAKVEPMDPAALRELADAVKGRLKSGLLLLGTVEEGRCHLVAGATPDLAPAYSASEIVKNAARFVGGGGGGRRDMAQAGGSNVEGVDSAVSSLSAWLAGRGSRPG